MADPALIFGAGGGSRTRDLELGKLALYQLSYVREAVWHLTPSRDQGADRTPEALAILSKQPQRTVLHNRCLREPENFNRRDRCGRPARLSCLGPGQERRVEPAGR